MGEEQIVGLVFMQQLTLQVREIGHALLKKAEAHSHNSTFVGTPNCTFCLSKAIVSLFHDHHFIHCHVNFTLIKIFTKKIIMYLQ